MRAKYKNIILNMQVFLYKHVVFIDEYIIFR
jgi:hypothetical protein